MTPRKRTHYQILGIKSDVSADEIKRAYRELAKAAHPDAWHGHHEASEEKRKATEEMMQINEAYATLIDEAKRADYDVKIGVKKITYIKPVFTSLDEDAEREKYLRKIFYPARTNIVKVLGSYKKHLKDLSADPYDDQLVEDFQAYVDKIESTLRSGADALARNAAPRSLEAAVLMMRNAIAQAADGLEELRYFCMNYDYNHLTMAETLFRISRDLTNQSLNLTKGK
jgi:molecular chaperone DnaJ